MTIKYIFNPFTAKFDAVDTIDTSAFATPTPVFIVSGTTFTVPRYSQALFTMAIDAEGVIDTDGVLAEVT